MKYIDADKLLTTLERQNTDKKIIQPLIRIIDSLQQEQPEADLKKELENWRHEHFCGERDGHYSGEYLERSSQLEIARHFYELGLRRAAEMYDEIEYNRQRAEESK